MCVCVLTAYSEAALDTCKAASTHAVLHLSDAAYREAVDRACNMFGPQAAPKLCQANVPHYCLTDPWITTVIVTCHGYTTLKRHMEKHKVLADERHSSYLQPLGDLLDRVLHNLAGPQASVPQLVADLTAEPVRVGCSQRVEVQSCLSIHANAQVVVHCLVLCLQAIV